MGVLQTVAGKNLIRLTKGFVVVCGGKFDVVIDGDQFKVTITFPVSEEISAENE